MYETNLQSLIDKGYALTASHAERYSLMATMAELQNNMLYHGNYVFGDNTYQQGLNATALSGLTLTETTNTATTIQNVMDGTAWINTGSNYTRQTTADIIGEVLSPDGTYLIFTADHEFDSATIYRNGAEVTTGFVISSGIVTFSPVEVTGETLADSGDHITYTASHIPLAHKIYKNGTEITTGFTVSGKNITFDSANEATDVITLDYSYNPNTATDVITADYTYTLAQPFLKAIDPAQDAVIVANAIAIADAGYAVLKTVQTGLINYELSMDAGTTFKRIYPGQGTILFDKTNTGNAVLRITITGDATVSKFGLSFR